MITFKGNGIEKILRMIKLINILQELELIPAGVKPKTVIDFLKSEYWVRNPVEQQNDYINHRALNKKYFNKEYIFKKEMYDLFNNISNSKLAKYYYELREIYP